jgi:hypothetical protein
MIFSYVGDPYVNILGMCRLDKKLVPWLYMLMIYFTIPDSSFLGHFCGLIAGLLIKFGGVYAVMPRYEWIQEFDQERGLTEGSPQIGYFPGQKEIETDFDAYIWDVTWKQAKHAIMKIR